MFDIDDFNGDCRAAVDETDPRRAVREALERAVSEPAAVGDALRPTEGGFTLLHHAPDLTVLHVVWAPGMRIFPHDHQMWAAIGIYAGQEDNEFFRRVGPDRRGLTSSGGRELAVGDVVLLGDDTIHAVSNPLTRLTAAIHVYARRLRQRAAQPMGTRPGRGAPLRHRRRPPAVRRSQRRLAGRPRRMTGWAAAGEDGGHRDVDRAPEALPTSPITRP